MLRRASCALQGLSPVLAVSVERGKPPQQRGIYPMRHLTATLLLALSACATTGPRPVEVRTQTVKVVVRESCVVKSQIPAMPPRVGPSLSGDAQADASLLAASAIRLRSALEVAVGLLNGCL